MSDEQRARIVLVVGSLERSGKTEAMLEILRQRTECRVLVVSEGDSPRELARALDRLDALALIERHAQPPTTLVIEALTVEALPELPVLASAPRSGPARDPRAQRHDARARNVLRRRGRRS